MYIRMRQWRWHENFHGIPWNLKCANFVDTSSSMEFHGIWSVPISLTRAVPWNWGCAHSMEKGVCQFRWHEISSMEFHVIPWHLMCTNYADTSSSMEFRGTWSAPISLTRAVPWNSMELRMRQLRWHEQFHGMEFHGTCGEWIRWHEQLHGIPWNSIELEVPQICWHEQFRGIRGYLKCANFADKSSSMEFHGTSSAPISMTRAVPWNSVELGIRQFRWYEQFHGVPWNSMELGVRQIRWHWKFHGIPWN